MTGGEIVVGEDVDLISDLIVEVVDVRPDAGFSNG